MNADTPLRVPSPKEFLERLGKFRTDRRLQELAAVSGIAYSKLWQIAARGQKPLLEAAHALWPAMDRMDAADAARNKILFGNAPPPPPSSAPAEKSESPATAS